MTATATDADNVRLAAVAAYEVIDLDRADPVIADLESVCELAATLAGVSTAVINLFDDRLQHQVAAFGVDPRPCRADESMCQTTLAAGRDICIPDARADLRFAKSPWVDGRYGQIRFYCSTILCTPTGEPIGTLCVFDGRPKEASDQQRRALRRLARQVMDILELRLRTRQLEQANAELIRSQDRLAAFAGQVSHDLKAPITAILGFTELLGDLDAQDPGSPASAYLARCSSAAQRMLVMIDDLLAFARVGGTLHPVVNRLDGLVAEIVSDLGAAATDARVTARGPDVLADRAQFRALLQNLIGNALRYRSAAPAIIDVVSERTADQVIVRVIDNGIGIPAERRADVLRPLVRLRKDIPGAGLGLAVCVRVAAAHGGTIRLEATPGGGTTAVVTLPAG